MLKAEQVPNEVWIAMQSAIGDHVSVATQKEAIAAAINAWPGMRLQTMEQYFSTSHTSPITSVEVPSIILPCRSRRAGNEQEAAT